MSIIKRILKETINKRSNQDFSHNYNNEDNKDRSVSFNRKGNYFFFLMSFFSGLFFVLFGIYELLFKSPLASWIQGILQSILKTSPQSLVNLPNQITGSEAIMQKTVGDWLSFVPGSFSQIWAIIFSPSGAIIGILLVIFAIIVRLGCKFIPQSSNFSKVFLKIISWVILVGSFVPLILEYGF